MQISPAARSWHIERYTVPETGELILLNCSCKLRNGYTFQDWVSAGLNPRPPAEVPHLPARSSDSRRAPPWPSR